MKKPIVIITSIISFVLFISPAFAKRIAPKPVTSIVKDGIEYSAPLDSDHIGYVIATWQKSKCVIWSKQIYVIKYEFKRGLEQDVQWVFISKLRLASNKLIITNELDYEYELDLDSLNVKVLKGASVIDNTKGQPQSKDSIQSDVTTTAGESRPGLLNNVSIKIGPYIAALFGGIGGAIVTLLALKKQRDREYKSLILTFSAELVTAFERCVMYYTQAQSGQVSYSALFSFTDAGALTRLAAVSKLPEVVAGILELKAMYFQIQRHVEEASKFAVDSSLEAVLPEQSSLMNKAFHAQGRALAFFLGGYYQRIIEETERILTVANSEAPGDVTNNLKNRFAEAKKKKEELDRKQKATQNSNPNQ